LFCYAPKTIIYMCQNIGDIHNPVVNIALFLPVDCVGRIDYVGLREYDITPTPRMQSIHFD